MCDEHFQFLLNLSIPSKPGSHESLKETNQHDDLFCTYHQILQPTVQKIVEETPPGF